MSKHQIKICGLTRECDIDYINEACPDYIGFVFAESRRRIGFEEAKKMQYKLSKGIRAAGVFVDSQPEQIIALVEEGVINAIQLHGHETAEYVSQLRGRMRNFDECIIIKALNPGDRKSQGDRYKEYADAGVNFFLFDSGSNKQAGGTGQCFDWQLVPRISYPYFLAGGLCIGNIEQALQEVAPYGVDISSGVETGGVKDRDKILEIIRRIRNV